MALTGREAVGLVLRRFRLRMAPRTPESFGLWLENPALQAQALGFAGPGGAWDASSRAAMRQLCAQSQARPDDYPGYASWQMVSRTERKSLAKCSNGQVLYWRLDSGR